ncbi:DMT family transporter [Halalkalibacter oceani]|uniref:DMT family transporter n=1 Tax=Halalkalibacter oceani TaxID=1653776 RepID=UPI00339494B1
MYKVLLGIISVTLVWGYTWVTMKIAISDIPPFLFSALRLLIGALPLLMILLIQRQKLTVRKQQVTDYVIMSFLMGIGYLGALTYGMQFVDSGKTAVLVYTMPIFVTVISHFLLQERITKYKMAGLLFCFVGLLFILGREILHFEGNAIIGQLLILLAALSWGAANVFSKVRFRNTNLIHMNAWQLMIGTTLLFAVSFLTERNEVIVWSREAVLSLLFNGLFSTAFTFVVWFWVLNQIEASKATMALMVVPVLGLFFGWLQLGETVTAGIMIGAGLICAGIFFNTYHFRSTAVPSEKRNLSS